MKALESKNNLSYWLVLLIVPMLLVVSYAFLAKAYVAHESTILMSDTGSALADSN